MKAAGFSVEEILTVLPEVRVESVLTAHPTEAKRAAVLEQHRAIFLLLSSLEDERLTPSRREAIRDEIKIVLERLWRSGEILLEKPEIASERRGVIFYMREVFLAPSKNSTSAFFAHGRARTSIPRCWKTLASGRAALGSWVGGDRDGHPFVTAKVTEETLGEMRLNAMLAIHRHLEKLAEKLPLSSNFQSPPESLERAIARLRAENPDSESIVRQHSDEPWRQYVMLLQAKLPLASADTDDPSTLDGSMRYYRNPHELDEDLICSMRRSPMSAPSDWLTARSGLFVAPSTYLISSRLSRYQAEQQTAIRP